MSKMPKRLGQRCRQIDARRWNEIGYNILKFFKDTEFVKSTKRSIENLNNKTKHIKAPSPSWDASARLQSMVRGKHGRREASAEKKKVEAHGI